MLTAIYTLAAFTALLPWSYIVKFYGLRINLKETFKELLRVRDELLKLPESRLKKRRILKEHYKELRGRINRFIVLNLIILWVGIMGSLMFARLALISTAGLLGINPYIPSPLKLPYVSVDGALNDLVLYLAILLGYIPIHNKITGINLLRSYR